ncbi:MAG: hypothetical protein QRY74_04005 [Chlamydia sp.]
MSTPILGHTASLVTLYALHTLLPNVLVNSSETNGNFFSFAIDPSKRIGPEFREFLFEAIQYLMRSDLKIRAFSMMKAVLIGYLEKEKIQIDVRLEELLYAQDSDSKALVDVVEIDNRFCALQEPDATFLPSSGAVKWIDLLPIVGNKDDDSFVYIRGAVGSSAKQASRRKKALEAFFLPEERIQSGEKFQLFSDRNEFQKQSILFSKGLEDLYSSAALFKASLSLLPIPQDEVVLDLQSPTTYLRSLFTRWNKLIPFRSRAEVGFASIERVRLENRLSSILPVPLLKESTCLSCFYPSFSLELFNEFFEKCTTLCSRTTIYGNSRLICEISSCYDEKEFMKKKSPFSIWENIQKRLSDSDILYSYRQDRSLSQMHICCTFSSFLLEEMECPIPRSSIIVSFQRRGGAQECSIIPFFSYEMECIILGEGPFCSFVKQQSEIVT